VRTKEVARENGFWAVESATSPELAKDPFGNGRIDGCESLGQVEGAQGVLTQPECVRGCRHTQSAAALRRRNETNVERLI